ncbi:anti-sigma factor family protein [Nonomuraea sp. NPDC059194]|uniref:anti-sigma factor family protein n=1 Tax=Nonomuraea sp. NPDC059194 TaxID=3346764 RepID=UPI0036866AB0
MTCEEVRLSLGAYTLGALDPDEALEVEVHLASCEACTDELMELEGVSSFLAKVSEKDVALVASPPREVLDRLLNDRVKRHRRGRILLALAASVAVLAVGGTVWTSTQQVGPTTTAAREAPAKEQSNEGGGAPAEARNKVFDAPSASPDASASGQDSLAAKAQGRAFNGSSNGVDATVTVTPGMPLQVQVSGVPSGTECTLVVVSKGGERERTKPWEFTESHYEEGAAVFAVESRTPQASIRAFEIRDDRDRLLVTIPVQAAK